MCEHHESEHFPTSPAFRCRVRKEVSKAGVSKAEVTKAGVSKAEVSTAGVSKAEVCILVDE